MNLEHGGFSGKELRIARLANDLTMEELGKSVGVTRQYIHKLETGQDEPTEDLLESLAGALWVLESFFEPNLEIELLEDQFHFRKKSSTRVHLKQSIMAKGTLLSRFAEYINMFLDYKNLKLKEFSIFDSVDDIEDIADKCRELWGLGKGPIDNMTRLVENLGILTTNFDAEQEVDAFSIASKNPIIMRNEFKKSVCRQRFDLAHELGHLILHAGVETGDQKTESEANRFAGALLIPRSIMYEFFPKPRGKYLNWSEISSFKLTWKMSKAAIIYRARQLDLITDSQYRGGFITLRRKGEAITESEDYLISKENPELLGNILTLLAKQKKMYPSKIAQERKMTLKMFKKLIGVPIPMEEEQHALKVIYS